MKIVFDAKESKRLFLKYAVPCGNVLVRRKKLSTKELDSIKSRLMGNRDVRNAEKIFRIASNMCYIIAKKMGKNKIDKAVIRKYFWNEHDKAINWRHRIYKDFDSKLCRVYPGRIIKLERAGKAIVLTPIGKRKLKTDFIDDMKAGDLITVHYGYCIEKITGREFRRLWNKYEIT